MAECRRPAGGGESLPIGKRAKRFSRFDRKDPVPCCPVLYHLGDVLRILERHAAYASFKSTYDHYDRSGIRGVKFRFARSRLRQQLISAWKPRRKTMVGTPHPEHTVMAGSHLPARLHLTIGQIAEIERWWKLHK
jgi:hypothetical protein